MQEIVMKHLRLTPFVIALSSLTACHFDHVAYEEPQPTPEPSSSLEPEISQLLSPDTKIAFDLISNPTSPQLILPTYLATDPSDHTLSVEQSAKDPNDLSDPIVAMGKTDGWSTSQAIQIEFKGKALDSNSAADSFFFLKSDSSLNSTRTANTELLIKDIDYKIKVDEQTLIVDLLKPLEPSSHYFFAIDNHLKDKQNKSVGTSLSYALLKSAQPIFVQKLKKAQQITHYTENAFAEHGVDKSKIIYSTWFKTASIGEALKGAIFASAQTINDTGSSIWKDSAKDAQVSNDDLNQLFKMTKPILNKDKETVKGTGEIYYGKITLPYFLEMDSKLYNKTPWQSGMPSVAKIRYTLTQGQPADQKAIRSQLDALGLSEKDLNDFEFNIDSKKRVITALAGQTLKLANGEQLDSERLITKFSPLPKLKSVETIEYSLILPKKAECQSNQSSRITIYQHGITSSKSSLEKSQLADELIKDQCQAILLINHPLHGDRGIGGNTAGINPQMYLNLENLTTARDNLRQSAVDIFNFRAAIALLEDKIKASTDAENEYGKLTTLAFDQGVHFAGHSLGAISGIHLGGTMDALWNETEETRKMFQFNQFALENPGAQIPYLLLSSQGFSPLIKGNLAINIDPDIAKACADKPALLPICYINFEQNLIQDGSSDAISKLKSIYDGFSSFAFASQTVLDTIDPTNYAIQFPEHIPVYLTQVKDDAIIPNSTPEGQTVEGTSIQIASSPFAGTTPLIESLNLTITTDSISNQIVKSAALFDFKGSNHSSITENNENPGTLEMQQQLKSFIQGNGQTLTVMNKNVIEK